MSIYDRATRNLGSIIGNQRPNLGPGTYNVPLARFFLNLIISIFKQLSNRSLKTKKKLLML